MFAKKTLKEKYTTVIIVCEWMVKQQLVCKMISWILCENVIPCWRFFCKMSHCWKRDWKNTAEQTWSSLRQIYGECDNQNVRHFSKLISTNDSETKKHFMATGTQKHGKIQYHFENAKSKINSTLFFQKTIMSRKEYALLVFTIYSLGYIYIFNFRVVKLPQNW